MSIAEIATRTIAPDETNLAVPTNSGPRRLLIERTFVHALLAALGIAFVAPVVWLIESAFNPHASQSLLWPHTISFANFSAAIHAQAAL
jgi:ABC-type glycerol-3-phosphate transport system permease component